MERHSPQGSRKMEISRRKVFGGKGPELIGLKTKNTERHVAEIKSVIKINNEQQKSNKTQNETKAMNNSRKVVYKKKGKSNIVPLG